MSLWRDRLRPASFRGVEFHVEEAARAGGRRAILHEYPKRDTPYAEDMGRKGGAFTVQGYLIGPDYILDREDLIAALETEGPGALILPTQGEFDAQPGPFSAIERRTQGGYIEISMNFLEAGNAGPFTVSDATQALVGSAADALDAQTSLSTTRQLTEVGQSQGSI